jgi:hypothetical protein
VAPPSQGRTAAAQCGLFTHKSVPVIFEPPCIFRMTFYSSSPVVDRRLIGRKYGGNFGSLLQRQSQSHIATAWFMLPNSCYYLVLLSKPDDGDDILLRNIGWFQQAVIFGGQLHI